MSVTVLDSELLQEPFASINIPQGLAQDSAQCIDMVNHFYM